MWRCPPPTRKPRTRTEPQHNATRFADRPAIPALIAKPVSVREAAERAGIDSLRSPRSRRIDGNIVRNPRHCGDVLRARRE